MRNAASFWITIAVAAVALVASAVLYVDYVRPAPVFCAEGGCGLVKKTLWAHPLGVNWLPMPLFGVAGFFAIALSALVPGRRARIAQASLAVFGAIVAVGLLAVQALMGTICTYCATADAAALVVAGLSILRALKGWDPPAHRAHVVAAVLGTVAAIGVPLGWGFAKRATPADWADLPGVIASEIQKTSKGKITVVDFADFECPFCRSSHAKLAPVLEAHKGEIRLVRKNVPLRMHPHAMEAARAQSCSADQGKGDEMAEALFKAEDMTTEGCRALAGVLGLDLAKFDACLKDPAIDARIRADGEAFRAAKGRGLPLLFIGAHRLDGEPQDGEIEHAFELAKKEL